MRKLEQNFIQRRFDLNLSGVENAVSEIIKLETWRYGSELANFKDIIQNRGNATTELDAGRMTGYYSPGYCTFHQNWPVYDGKDGSGGLFFSTVRPGVDAQDLLPDAVAKCRSKYFSKLKSLRTIANGQEILGELRETMEFMRRPFSKAVELLTTLVTLVDHRVPKVKRDPRRKPLLRKDPFLKKFKREIDVYGDNTKYVLSDAGASWLEVRFALLPLIADCAALSELLTRTATQERVHSYRCYGKEESSSTRVETYSRIYGVNHSYNVVRTYKAESIIRFGYLVKAMTAFESRNALIQESFLNYKDIPSTAWELLPMSWLADYFFNVGSMIQAALESQQNVVWTSESTVLSGSVEYLNGSLSNFFVPRSYLLDYRPVELGVFSRTVKRTTAPIGTPPLVCSLPRSDIRLANVAALLSSLLR